MREPVPLAAIQDAVLRFLRNRDDAVVFGAQAVNAYASEPRMSQDVDILSTDAAALAEEMRKYLAAQFHIAVRVRRVGEGRGYRVFQVRKPKNRHLVDIRQIVALPPTRRIGAVSVVAPEELIARKVIAFHQRRGAPKSGTDWRDLAMLLLRFPKLKSFSGPVGERLHAAGAGPEALAVWKELVQQDIRREDEDAEF